MKHDRVLLKLIITTGALLLFYFNSIAGTTRGGCKGEICYSIFINPDDTSFQGNTWISKLKWAIELQSRIDQKKYSPNVDEKKALQKIIDEFQDASVIKQGELEWAIALEQKVKNGYTPSQEETVRYESLAKNLQIIQEFDTNKPVVDAFRKIVLKTN